MPGTHYDNDYSFIDDLPFEYRRGAAFIIRQISLSDLLQAVKQKYHPIFDEMEPYPSHAELVERTLYATLVAKITFYAKDSYISEKEFLFLEMRLYDAIYRLMDCEGISKSALHKALSLAHYKSFDWLTRPRDESRRYALEVRKRSENARRYFRYYAQLTHHFVRLGNHEKEQALNLDIHSSGVIHFSKLVNQKLNVLADNYQQQIHSALAEIHPQAHILFETVFKQYQELRQILNGISIGRLEISKAKWLLKDSLSKVCDYSALKENKRTENMLEDFRAKLNQISHNTLVLLENSTPHELFQGPELEKLKVDQDIYKYIDVAKKNKSRLMKAFVSLYYFSHLLEKIYNNIASSQFIIMFPEFWVDQYHNISSGGFAFYSEFLVYQNDILEIMLRINKSSDPDKEDFEVIQQKAKVIRIEEDPEKEMYIIACQFLLSEEHNLKTINHAVQAYEIREAYGVFSR